MLTESDLDQIQDLTLILQTSGPTRPTWARVKSWRGNGMRKGTLGPDRQLVKFYLHPIETIKIFQQLRSMWSSFHPCTPSNSLTASVGAQPTFLHNTTSSNNYFNYNLGHILSQIPVCLYSNQFIGMPNEIIEITLVLLIKS